MTLSTTFSMQILRRARFIGIVLFGAFVYFYASRLQAERLLFWLRSQAQSDSQLQQILQLQPFHIGLAAMTIAMGIAVIAVRGLHFRQRPPLLQTLMMLFAAIFLLCTFTSPDEQTTIVQRMERLNLTGHYDEALLTGRTCEQPSAAIVQERIIALEHLGILGESFFTSPLGHSLPAPGFFISAGNHPTPHARLRLHSMLERNLPALAEQCKNIPTDSLQRAEQEALTLYNHKSANPILVYHNAAIETNYNDFTSLQKKIRTQTNAKKGKPSWAEANQMREAYGETYWYYYYYGTL